MPLSPPPEAALNAQEPGRVWANLGLWAPGRSYPQAARALADAILARSPDAVSATKALFHSTRHAAEDQAFDQESSLQFKLLRGRNQGEAMAANLKKREPRFRPRQRDY